MVQTPGLPAITRATFMETVNQVTTANQMGGNGLCSNSECGPDGKLNEFNPRKTQAA